MRLFRFLSVRFFGGTTVPRDDSAEPQLVASGAIAWSRHFFFRDLATCDPFDLVLVGRMNMNERTAPGLKAFFTERPFLCPEISAHQNTGRSVLVRSEMRLSCRLRQGDRTSDGKSTHMTSIPPLLPDFHCFQSQTHYSAQPV